MRKTTVVGFLATVAIAVPAGWHFLDADLQKDGKLVRPLQGVAKIDDTTTVSIDADHAIIAPGGRVKVRLVATSERPHPVPIEMTVMVEGSVGPEERVPTPLEAIDRERFVLPAGPGGGKAVETYVTLGHRQKRSSSWSETFRIFIGSPHGKLPNNESDLDPNPETREFAGIGVLEWGGNKMPLSIEAPKTVEKGKPFEVALRMKNTSNHTLHWAWFELGSQIDVRGITHPDGDATIESDDTDLDIELKPGQQRVKKYTVTALRDGTISLLAQSIAQERAPEPGSAAGWTGGAMDVVRIPVGLPAVASN